MSAATKQTTAATAPAARSAWILPLAGLGVLIAGGLAHRALTAQVDAALRATVRLERPLATLPLEIGDWIGRDLPLTEGVRRIAGNDDDLSRGYRRVTDGAEVLLYVGYTAHPRTMLRHRPSVCYPSAGWVVVSTGVREAPTPTGPPLELRVHCFAKPGLVEQRRVVAHYYLLDGVPTIDDHSFWSPWRRTVQGTASGRGYVAQVQISASADVGADAAEQRAVEFASAAAPLIGQLLPGRPATPSASVRAAPDKERGTGP